MLPYEINVWTISSAVKNTPNASFFVGSRAISCWAAKTDVTPIFQEVLASDQIYHLLHDLGEQSLKKHGIKKILKASNFE